MDEVFRALADPTRRSLLDELFREDGQTLSALEERFADDALRRDEAPAACSRRPGSWSPRRAGREKLHFLNPVPIRLVHDRWVSKYAEPWAAALSDLKTTTGGAHDGEGLRDLHQDDARAALGGDHRPRDPGQVQLRRRRHVRLDARLALRDERTRRLPGRSARARSSRSIRRAGSCRRFGALWSDDVKARGRRRASPGRSSRSATRAASPSRTTSCARARNESSTAAGR